MEFGPTARNPLACCLRVPQAGDFERFAEVLGSEEAARYIGGHAAARGGLARASCRCRVRGWCRASACSR